MLQMVGKRLFERLRHPLALVSRGRDQPVDLERDRLHQGAALPVAEYGCADLDRIAEQPREPIRFVLEPAVTGDLDDGPAEAEFVYAKFVADELDWSFGLRGD